MTTQTAHLDSSANVMAGDGPDLEALGVEAAYLKFLPEARALDSAHVVPYRGGAELAAYNYGAALRALAQFEARIAAELPALNLARVKEGADVAQAVIFAARKVDRDAPPGPLPPGEISRNVARANECRGLLLDNATGLARKGLVDRAEVARIRKGRGSFDIAKDCVDLAALFRAAWPTIRDKTPVTEEDIQLAASLGTSLLATLRPKGAQEPPLPPALQAAIADRDRLWTLLTVRFATLWSACAWFLGPAVVDQVPLLLSRELGARPR